jgi:hypothetical protein
VGGIHERIESFPAGANGPVHRIRYLPLSILSILSILSKNPFDLPWLMPGSSRPGEVSTVSGVSTLSGSGEP